MLLRIWLLGSLLLMAPAVWSQEKTFLAPTPVKEGEDPDLRKSLYEAWDKLPRALKVSGAVVDAAGKAVSKAKLTVQADIGIELEGRADEEGKFYFEAPLTRFYLVTARSDEGDLLAVGMPKQIPRDGMLSLKLTALPTKEVTLQVRSKAGMPIAGAYYGATLAGVLFAKGKCDEEGRFTVRAPESIATEPDDQRPEAAHFYAMAPGHGLNIVKGEYYERGFEFPNELILPTADPLTITVTDRDQKPLAGIPIYLPHYSVQKGESAGGGMPTVYRNVIVPICLDMRSLAKTNGQGEATISWFVTPKPARTQVNGFSLANDRPITMPVFAMHPEWGTGAGVITVDGEQTKSVCTLYGPSLIRGRATLPNGEPAAGIVLASPEDSLSSRRITTDAKGEFEFTATMMDLSLAVTDSKWIADPIKVYELVRQSPEHRVELKLREGKRVTIRVTAGAQYAPLANQVVQISGAGLHLRLRTDDQGRAEATLDRGNYRIHAMSDEIYKQLRAPQQVGEVHVLVKDLPEVEIPIHFDIAQPRVLKVTVLKPDGVTPIGKAKIEILNPFQADARTELQMQRAQAAFGGPNAGRVIAVEREVPVAFSVLSDSDGKAELRAPVDAPAFLMATSEEGARAIASVDILDDAATITLRKTVTAKGKLIDEVTGDAITGREMEMKLVLSKLSPSSQFAPRGREISNLAAITSVAKTDDEGNFEIKDLLPDTDYTLEVALPTNKPGEPRAAVRPAMIRLSGRGEQLVRTGAEGATDLGELKAKVYTPPVNARPAPFGNPNIVPAPR